MLGLEQGFFFADVKERRDWRRIFYATRHAIDPQNASLINRIRIRRLLEPIADLVELESRGPRDTSGVPASIEDPELGWAELSDDGSFDRLITPDMPMTGFTGEIYRHHDQLRQGCDVEQHRVQSFPSRLQENAGQFTVSMVRLGHREYIAGIGYVDSSQLGSPPYHLGFRACSRQQSIKSPFLGEVEALEVAFRPEGLVGLKVRLIGGESSAWLGRHDCEGAAYGIIPVPRMPDNRFHLVADLDVNFRNILVPFRLLTNSKEIQNRWTAASYP